MHTRGAVLLEPTFARVDHPDHLRLAGRNLTVIDDPALASVAGGDGLLGWEGDPRLAVYADAQAGQWLLVRLERDGVYRIVCSTTAVAGTVGALDLVGRLVQWLVTHDTRRGYDPAADAQAHNAALERRLDRVEDDWLAGELVPRLGHALRRDLGTRSHF